MLMTHQNMSVRLYLVSQRVLPKGLNCGSPTLFRGECRKQKCQFMMPRT